MWIPVRSSTLLLPLAEVESTHIAGRCLNCRTHVSMPLAAVMQHTPGAIVGQVAARFRCKRCGSRPSALILIDDAQPTPAQDDFETINEVQLAGGLTEVAIRGHVVAGNARSVSVRYEEHVG